MKDSLPDWVKIVTFTKAVVIPEKLREAKIKSKMTFAELAERSGVSFSLLSDAMNHRTNMSEDKIRKVDRALKRG